MKDVGLRRIVESKDFEWPWEATQGLLIISGASGGGGITNGKPSRGRDGVGCNFGGVSGGPGGRIIDSAELTDALVADGGDGGGGFPGETVVIQIENMSLGEPLRFSVGKAGRAGSGGEGYRNGSDGSLGNNGEVILVSLFEE